MYNKQAVLRKVLDTLATDPEFSNAEVSETDIVVTVTPSGEPSFDVKITLNQTHERDVFEEPTTEELTA